MATKASRLLTALSLSLALSLATGLARAQENTAQDPDPPDRAARLSYLQGDVSMQPAGEDDWAPAIVNRPLTTGDKLWTEQGARAEIYVGQSAVRLDGGTGFSFLNVDDDTIQMRMTAGVLNVRVRAIDENDHIEVDTPNVALSLLRPGNYRVEVNDAGDATVVKISEGEAEATGGSQDVIVHNQQAVTFRGGDQLAAQFGTLGAPDDFDSWSLERDRRDDEAARSRTAQYVAPDVTGYEDLEDNGAWSSDPEYGYVWTPTHVAVDWAPYRFGRWSYVGPWGWTWIDDAPWGYAPFHYGRWAYARNRWCWVPGPRAVRAVYAPALVGWVGSPGVNVSVSFGSGVAWFPLGPREVYVPARRYSPRYVERVNVTNTVIVNRTYITNVYNNPGHVNYRYRAVPGAVTVVSRNAFTNSERVGNNRLRVDQHELARAHFTGAAPHIAPVRESRMGGPTRVYVRPPPPTVTNRQVVVRRAPPPTGTRYTRNPGNHMVAPPRTPVEHGPRPQDQGPQDRNETRSGNVVPAAGNHPDHPSRVDRPMREPEPNAPPANVDGHVVTERPRANQPRNDRPPQPRPEQQRETEYRERQQRQDEQNLQMRQQAAREAQQREAQQRQATQHPAQQREHTIERPRAEQQPAQTQPRREPPHPQEQPRQQERPREEHQGHAPEARPAPPKKGNDQARPDGN